jgi:dihydroorotase
VHHLWFTADDYERLGGLIKCNPAIKAQHHRARLREALLEERLDIIATDHAPHTLQEKQSTTADGQPDYFAIPSGLPLVQHSFNMMFELHRQGLYSLEFIVDKMCHKPALCFNVKERGFIREGYYADMFLFDPDAEWTVAKENLRYKCKWSPLEGQRFQGQARDVFVNGNHVFSNGSFDESVNGLRLAFDRN